MSANRCALASSSSQMLKTNLVLSSAGASERMAGEAIRYQRMIKSAPKAVPQALPTVQRPGVQRDGPRAER